MKGAPEQVFALEGLEVTDDAIGRVVPLADEGCACSRSPWPWDHGL